MAHQCFKTSKMKNMTRYHIDPEYHKMRLHLILKANIHFFAGSGIVIIAKVTINCRDLIKTIQWSLLEFPKNINIIARIITHIADKVKVLEVY